MKLFFDIVQVVIGILLIFSIIIQANSAGLGAAFGGGDSITTTRRGAEKGIFIVTVILSVLFIVLAAVRIFIG